MKRYGGFLAFLLLVLASSEAYAAAFDAEKYFKGKTIRFVTGSRPGGGTDILLRYMAANWGKYFPGNPRFVVSNLPPHVHGLNLVWRSKPDGLTVFMHSTGILREQVLPQAEFKSSQFRYVGDIGDRSFVLTGYNLPYRDLRDAMGKKGPPLRYLDMIPSPEDMHPQAFQLMLLAHWLNLPVEFGVIAERGTSIVLLEMERGNMNVTIGGAGRWFGWPKLRPGWVREGKLKPLLDMTFFGRRMLPNAEFKDVEWVPHVYSLLSKEQREIWTALIEGPQAMEKPIVLPPGTPDEILGAYRKALESAMNDAKFREDIERITGIPPVWVRGEEVQKEAAETENLWLRYRDQEKELRRQMYAKYIRK
jgi:hypothetical protein